MKRYFSIKQNLWLIVLTGTLTVLLAVSIGFNMRQSQMARAYELQLSNIYDRAFFDIVEGMANIEVKLSKLIISESKSQIEQNLSDIVRVADQTTANLASLPISHAIMGDTIKFSGQVSDFCRVLLKNVSADKPISSDDAQSLLNLHAQAAELSSGLDAARNTFTIEPMTWAVNGAPDLYAMPSEAGGESPFSDITRGGVDYPALIYDGPFSDGAQGAMRGLSNFYIDEIPAMEIAKNFVGAQRVKNIQPTGESSNPPAWNFDITTIKGGVLTLCVSKQGGHVLWMLGGATASNADIQGTPSYEAFTKIAQEFLVSRGFLNMEPNYWQFYNGVVVINFSATQDGVVLYPDLVKVQQNQLTGEVIGIEAHNYYTNHVPRADLIPTIREEEARLKVSDRLDVRGVKLALIPMGLQELLCYEFSGKYADEDYIVYIDAMNGEEVNILKVIHMENGTLTL